MVPSSVQKYAKFDFVAARWKGNLPAASAGCQSKEGGGESGGGEPGGGRRFIFAPAGQEGCPGRRADFVGVEPVELEAGAGQRVDGWSVHFWIMVANTIPAEVLPSKR